MDNELEHDDEVEVRTRLCAKVEHSPEPTHGMSTTLFILLASYSTFAPLCTDQYQANMREMAVEFDCSNQAMSFTVQVKYMIFGASSLVMGSLSDYHGRVVIFRACCALLVCSTACCALAPSYWVFLAGRVMQGIGEGGLALVHAILRDHCADPVALLVAESRFALFGSLSVILGPAFGGLIGSYIGWRYPFLILSLLFLLCLLASWTVLKESAPEHADFASYRKEVLTVLGNLPLLAIIISFGFARGTTFLLDSNYALLLEDEYGQSVRQTSVLIGLTGVLPCISYSIADKTSVVGPFLICKFIASVAFALEICLLVLECKLRTSSFYCFVGLQSLVVLWMAPFSMGMETLFLLTTEDVAGAAQGIKQLGVNTIATLVSVGGSAAIAHKPTLGMLWTEVVALAISMLVFWIGLGLNPPDWVHGKASPRST